MDYKELIENLERRGMKNGSSLCEHSGLYEQAAYAITDLLARSEEAEARRDEARKDCAVAERNHMIEVERRKSAEAREKKAERERDTLIKRTSGDCWSCIRRYECNSRRGPHNRCWEFDNWLLKEDK